MRINDFIAEDSNQFGPGTDLMISLLAVLLIICLMVSHLYDSQRRATEAATKSLAEEKKKNDLLQASQKKKPVTPQGGNFKLSSVFFSAGDFAVRPVTKLTDEARTENMIQTIAQEYKASQVDYPFIFIIGHSNQIDDPRADDQSYSARLQRNWEYAGKRAGVIASRLQEYLTDEQKDKIIIISSGEFDLRSPNEPFSQENAWVEVVFGREWKIPAKNEIRTN